jgi:Ni,Fe-hydrogenase III small subunit
VFAGHPEVKNGAASAVPVDLFIPGWPPYPLTILDGLLRILGRLENQHLAKLEQPFLPRMTRMGADLFKFNS